MKSKGKGKGIKAAEVEVGSVFSKTHIRLPHRCKLLLVSNTSVPRLDFQKRMIF